VRGVASFWLTESHGPGNANHGLWLEFCHGNGVRRSSDFRANGRNPLTTIDIPTMINYSLKAIFERDHTDKILRQLAARLTSDCAARIEALTWAPATQRVDSAPGVRSFLMTRGIDGIELLPFESGNNYHFKLNSTPLEPYYLNAAYMICSRPMAPGSCACLLTSFFGGRESLILEMTSQLESMSQLLETSDEIHALWRDFGRDAGAVVAYVDREDENALMVNPEGRPIIVPDFFTIRPSDDLHYSIDLTVERIRKDNGV
jgi:hypothetical protein